MQTLINCGSDECASAEDGISIMVKDGDENDFVEIKKINGRYKDINWKSEYIKFEVENSKVWVS